MADIAAIVDMAESLGLQGGKRGTSARGGHGASLADFLSTFTARLAVDEGKASAVPQAAQGESPDLEADPPLKAAPAKDDPVAALVLADPGESRPNIPVLALPGQAVEGAVPGGEEDAGESAAIGARRLAHLLARHGDAGGVSGKAELDVSAKPADEGMPLGQKLPLDAQAVPEAKVDPEAPAVQSIAGSQGDAVLSSGSSQPLQSVVAENLAVRPNVDAMPKPVEHRLNVAVEAPLKSPAFPAEFSEKIVWLTSRQGQVAELSLNPPQMGTVEVRLTLSPGGEAGAQFFSPNPVVREAIEAALPRLRELMAQAGIQLGESQVRDQAMGQGGDRTAQSRNGSEGQGDARSDTADILTGARRRGLGLVDLYA